MKKLSCVVFSLLLLHFAQAQQQFVNKGKIEYEKRVNLHRLLDFEEDETWRNMMKKSMPAVKLTLLRSSVAFETFISSTYSVSSSLPGGL